METFNLHSSQISKVMAYPEKKEVPKGAQTYIDEWYKSKFFKRKKEFTSKYTSKGNSVEEMALKFISEQLGVDCVKNEEFFINDYICGTPDICTDVLLADNKSPFDCFTFPFFDKEIPNKDYYYQLQGYMALTGHNSAKLIYTLMDTPEKIIKKEAIYYCSNNDYEFTPEIFEEYKSKMTYSDIPPANRIKIFEVERNEKDIDLIYQRVRLIRDYIKSNY